MNTQEIIQCFDRCVIPNYSRIPCALVRGEGSWVWDSDGNKYLDLFPGWGVGGLGHCHPRVVNAIQNQAEKLIHVSNTFYIQEQGALAEIMNRCSGMDARLFFCNSGAEAAEGAIKLARLHSAGRFKVVTAEGSFHGRTFAAISATGQPAYREGFGPTVPGFVHVPFNDIESVRAAVDADTCAIMVEPVQGEGGVFPATVDYLKGLRDLCDQKGLVLIFDEVQTSPGRLGTLFGYQYFGVQPDIMITAKALAGGLPMGAIMVKPELAASLRPGKHASTFGGSPMACCAAIAVFEVLQEDGFLEHIQQMGRYIKERLTDLKNRNLGIAEIRTCGLMIGIEMKMPGASLVRRCMEEGLLINCTHQNVLRLLPAYIISKEEIDVGLEILSSCLSSVPLE